MEERCEALAAGGGITSSKPVSLAAGGGTFLADAGTTSALSGLISGPGAWTKSGPGLLIMSGANTYAGGTTILGGTILTQNASALGTGPMAFGNGAALQVQNLLNVNGNWTVSPGTASVSGGTVQTFGDFNLGGGGTLIVNANFNVPGAANINSSGFVVNSAFTANDDINLNGSAAAVVNGLLTSPSVNVNTSSSLIVNNPGTVVANVNVGPSALLGLFGRINGSVVNAGFFQGTGVVNGNVFNSGIVSPGASIGTLTINGDYTQNASGTLRIEVAGASAGQYDVLAVNGRAFINGTLQLVRVGNFRLQVGDRIAFLTATGGVNGTFSNIENDFLATDSIVVLDVVYLANSAVLTGTQVVVLEGTQGSFAEFASLFCGTPNAIAVGEALDSAVGDPRASELIGFLNNEALTDLCEDIDLISPEQLTSIFVLGVSLANVQTANLERRMTDIRAGSNGFSGGFAINGSGPSFWGYFWFTNPSPPPPANQIIAQASACWADFAKRSQHKMMREKPPASEADKQERSSSDRASPPPSANPQPRELTPAARRALAEAEARRRNAAELSEAKSGAAKEIGGRGGLDPARYGDWEVKGIASDF